MSLPAPLDDARRQPEIWPGLLREALTSPRDLARWAFWVPLRDWLDPVHPERARRLWPLWTLAWRAGGPQRERMADEYRRIFAHQYAEDTILDIVRDAYRIGFRVHLEELLMGRFTAETMGNFLDLRGRENLDRALSWGRGAIVLSAHAGSFMLPIAALSLAGYPYTQYAARGMPPEDLAREHPEALPNNRWLAAARRVREESEDRLPARFLTLKTPARELYRVLERNEVVAMAFDGRIGHRWVRVPFLGREAVLNTGPYRLAEAMETPILPTLCRTPTRGRSVCEIGEPLRPGQGGWAALMRRFLAEHADPWLRRHPAEYGVWLAHCRLRNDVDDHPLFTDQAVDDRWRRHPSL